MSNNGFVIKFLILCLATALTATFAARVTGLLEHYRLAKNCLESQGIVISKQSHEYIEIEYKVNGQKYKTGGHADDIGKASVNIGEKVPVYFDPQNPDNATLGDPNNHLQSSLIETGIVSTFPIIMLLGFWLKQNTD